jgi:hypothetical protein
MFGGTIGNSFDAANSVVDLFGGTLGAQFTARDTIVNISGAEIGYGFEAQTGSQVNILSGSVGDYFESEDSVINISGGSVGNFLWASNSPVHLSGGSIGHGVTAGEFHIYGGDFRVDGELIEGLSSDDSSRTFELPRHAVLSGTLADGTPFAFTGLDLESDRLYGILLHASAPPLIGPAVVNVPSDAVPKGVRQGQTLIVGEGGVIRDNYNVGWNSALEVAGGQVGDGLEAVGASVTVSGGNVGQAFSAFYGTTVNITGGNVGQYFNANHGSVVNITGGSVGRDSSSRAGSIVNVSGGSIDVSFDALQGSTVNISGGNVGSNFSAARGSVVNITGGTVGYAFHADRGSVVNISGGDIGTTFRTTGNLNVSGGRLRGVSADSGSVVSVTGGEFDYFLAHTDSGVSISGATFGGTFEADGEQINISGGTFDAYFVMRNRSKVNMSGGLLNGQFNANPGSSINFFGTRFLVDGQDITRTLMQSVPYTITARDVSLYALLADGSPLSIDLNSSENIGNDSFSPDAVLTVTLFLPGDYNVDGIVNTGDYVVWRTMLGATLAARGSGADGNFDGQVTEADYDVWQEHFGQTLFGTIPEPSTICAAIVGWLASMCITSRYRCKQLRS